MVGVKRSSASQERDCVLSVRKGAFEWFSVLIFLRRGRRDNWMLKGKVAPTPTKMTWRMGYEI